MPIDARLVKWDDAPDASGIDARMVKWDKVKKPDKMDATEGMSTGEKFLAGIGKSMHDLGQGVGQMVGLTSRDDVAESRRLDADLMKTTAGKVGDFAGNVATTVPLAFVPGANTVKGASLIGSLTGLMQPSTSTQETATNTGFGGVIGGGSVLAGRGLAAAYQGATGLLRPLTGKGQRDIAAEVLQASATNPEKAIASAAGARPLVAGSNPTMAQVANDPGLAQLERTLLNKPESAGPLAQRYADQQAARKATIADVAGTPEHRAAIEEGRQIFANEDYAKAMAGGINDDAAKLLAPRIDSIMQRPSIQSAKMIAKNLAAEKDIALNDFSSVQGMDWIKKALDNQISKAQAGGSSIGKEKLSGLVQTKNDLMSVIEQLSPAYKEANDNFAKMSKQINAADVAADLQKRLYKNAEWGSGKELGSTYQGALSDALESVKKQTGMNKALSDVMSPGDLSKLEGIARDLSRKEAGQTLGRAVGSPTMQNMMGQNLIDRITGPLGAPQSFSQNVIANTLSRPYNFVMQSAEPRILGLLSEAVADPKKAAELLSMVKQPTKMGKLATNAEKFLSVPGLLALENR
jgi:hypothetical protein